MGSQGSKTFVVEKRLADSIGDTTLHEAVRTGDAQLVSKCLLHQKTKKILDEKNEYGDTGTYYCMFVCISV